jgi:hypothetical protein
MGDRVSLTPIQPTLHPINPCLSYEDWLSLPVLSGDRTPVVLIVVACNTIVV